MGIQFNCIPKVDSSKTCNFKDDDSNNCPLLVGDCQLVRQVSTGCKKVIATLLKNDTFKLDYPVGMNRHVLNKKNMNILLILDM